MKLNHIPFTLCAIMLLCMSAACVFRAFDTANYSEQVANLLVAIVLFIAAVFVGTVLRKERG